MSGIGNFAWSFFLEALALCFTTMAGTFSLHLDRWLAAAVVLVACTIGYMTGQSC